MPCLTTKVNPLTNPAPPVCFANAVALVGVPLPLPGVAASTPAIEAVTEAVTVEAAGVAAVEEVSTTLDPAPVGATEGAEDVEGGVGETDLALDGIKGTEAGFKFDLMLLLDDPPDAAVVAQWSKFENFIRKLNWELYTV